MVRPVPRDHGPGDREQVERAFLGEEVELASRNVPVVMGDIERSTGRHPDVEVDRYLGSVRISFNGNFTTPSVSEWENPDALVEVAAYLQEHMLDEVGLWPVCPTHDGRVLIPEVAPGGAVWRCRSGGHDAAPIGQLGRP